MNVTTLINLLNQAPDVNDRSVFYRQNLNDKLHYDFFQLIAGYQAGTLQFENNTLLNQIKSLLDDSFQQISVDTEPIGSILSQLADAAVTLEAVAGDSELPGALQTADTLYNSAMAIYDELNGFYQERLQIVQQRQQLNIGDPGTPGYNFAMDFDTELERDAVVILFLQDTFLSFTEKLSAVRIKIAQMIASTGNNPPPGDLSAVVGLLTNSAVVSDFATQTIQNLQNTRTTLFNLGQGLINRQIQLNDNPDLQQIGSTLDNMISDTMSKSANFDSLLNQLKSLATGFTTTAENPQLPGALSLASTRQQDAKILHEEAHLLNVEFNELDTFGDQLDGIQPTADELSFYAGYVLTIDKFHLLTTYLDGICGTFEFTTKQFADLFEYFLNDPHYKVQQFNDNLPFALLPVRLETRFMTIKHVCDNISYASVNDALRSATDIGGIKTTKQTNTLRETAAPISGLQLQTVSAQQQIPDQHELWVRIYPDDIAVHTHEDLLSQSELNDAQVYWNEKWKAVGDPNFELGAWRALCSSYGSRRAAWIISKTGPTNGPNPNTGTAPLTSLTTLPALPPLTPRPASWSQQPHTRVMPERFVVRVYSGGVSREVVGQVVPSPLPMGFDPMDPYTNYLGQNGTEINMPPDLRWLTHFEEAEKIGMGIRVPLLNQAEIDNGFDRLLVLGLKLDLNAATATQELETLLNNHHYATGLALVPQGTPTNNTDDLKSGYAGIEPGYEESYKTELGSNLFTNTSSHYDKADGQRLAEALGVNSNVFQHVANSNTFDVQESMTMTRALWPATLGYYLKNMLTPSLVQSNIDDTRTFFNDYVQGRGLIPAFRVRNQPYGVLTSTVYSKWKYSDPYSSDAKLHSNVLEKLRKYWIMHFFQDVKRITSNSTTPPDALFVNVMGLNASSVEFHQRITIGDMLASNIMQYLIAANQPQPNPAIANPTAANLLDALYKSYQMESFSYFNTPRIFSMAFAKTHRQLNGPVIDSLPLSEKRTIEKLGNGSANYIDWLAGSTIPYIRAENFSNVSSQPVEPPKALLYLLLRHAWLLEYLDTAHCLLTSVGAVSVDAWHNHELLKMTGETRPEFATVEQTNMLHGFVKAEVQYENELQIEGVMRNLSTNQQYLNSGMTPEQFQNFLRDQSAPAVEEATSARYGQRLNAYNVDQAQWSYLNGTYAKLSSELSVADYIRAQLNSGDPCFTKLRETNNAFAKLSALPTARLERCFAEHLDTCAYRLDSWLNGLVNKRLDEQRNVSSGGVYLGAFGILENPKPNTSFPGVHVVNVSNADSWNSAVAKMGQSKALDLTPWGSYPTNSSGKYIIKPASGVQPATFIYLGDDPNTKLIEDPESGQIVSGQQTNPDNQGFILAPSLNHAVAAAVMRAGYKAHRASAVTTETMAVTLTSDRVRTAIYYLEGIRNGQNLASMLGYQFERGLHERQQAFLPGLDGYIAQFRESFPLVAGTVINNPTGQNSDAQARQVTDGLQLLQAYARIPPATPWYVNISGIHSGSSYTADGTKIVLEIEKIKGDLDAIGDLLLTEAIYQVTRGNHERAGSVLQALGYGANIPEPEIIKTPRQADTFTHRCVVQLSPAATANANWIGTSIRANTEPAINNWLASQLPPPGDIRISYSFTGNNATLSVDMIDLGLQPIDLLAIFTASGSNGTTDATELSKRIILKARTLNSFSDNVEITIDYFSRAGFSSIHRTISN